MTDGARNTIATVCNVVLAVAVPALIATQAELEGNYQGVNKLNGLLSKNLDFDLNNYKGCGAGQILVNGACIDQPKDQVSCGKPGNMPFSWSGTFDKGAKDFQNSMMMPIQVTKVSVPTDEDGDRKWGFMNGRKRRAANTHDISLHETAVAIWNAGDDIVPVCINRPSVSLFTPHEVVMTGFSQDQAMWTSETGVIVPTSDATLDLAVATLEDADANRKLWNFNGGRKRRNAPNEEFCLNDDGNRKLWNFNGGRKRRNANPNCFANEGDAMLFQYPTGQYVLGGILQGQGSVEVDGDRKWGFMNGRKRRAANNDIDSFAFTNVLDYAAWIYKTSGVWSKIEEASASAFLPSEFSPETWKGNYPEFGLAELSRSFGSVIKALPALQIINDNSVEQLVDILMSAPAANQASGLDQFLCDADGDRKWFWNGRKKRAADQPNQCLCGSKQAAADGDRKFDFWNGRRKRDTTDNDDQCMDLNLDDLPVCGMTGDRKLWNWNGRKRREANDEQCIGDSNLGQLLGGFLDNTGDKKLWNFNG